MTDIVPQLRDMHARKNLAGLRHRAADEIERLTGLLKMKENIVVAMATKDAEIERLLKINADHCNAVNTLTIENSRQDDEIERLRAALKEIADSGDFSSGSDRSDLVLSRDIARQALTGREGHDGDHP